MYSNIHSVNVLTVLLRDHGVRHALLCPGSRNAPITHNLTLCPDIECHSATDERSAAFEAMGIALATNEPVAICVTSGSALLNVAPAVCEAYYQRVPLVVISADRPAAWIDQLDGQTIDQPGALHRWCCCSVNLPEICCVETERAPSSGKSVAVQTEHAPSLIEQKWHCNYLVNRALIESKRCLRPVHINIPISEPLYEFTTPELPSERIIRLSTTDELLTKFRATKRVMIVVGQTRQPIHFGNLAHSAVIVAEPLANTDHITPAIDDYITQMPEPEMIIYLGGTLVGKNIKRFLRNAKTADQWFISPDGDYADTFMNLKYVVFDDVSDVLIRLNEYAHTPNQCSLAVETERAPSSGIYVAVETGLAPSSGIYAAVQTEHAPSLTNLEEQTVATLEKLAPPTTTFIYANSLSVRYACRYSTHYIYCNRGVNGIEGTVSTALGIAIAKPTELCVCVTGDLSFLYDSNALWRTNLPHNLRILLLNNGGGKIFRRFNALNDSPAHDAVTGHHTTSCRGLCLDRGIEYKAIENDIEDGVNWLLSGNTTRLLELLTR